jgi:Flp pilus assembly protein TadB
MSFDVDDDDGARDIRALLVRLACLVFGVFFYGILVALIGGVPTWLLILIGLIFVFGVDRVIYRIQRRRRDKRIT